MLSKEEYVEKIVRDILNSEMKLEDFVAEHFELDEKIKWLKEEMTEPAFNLIFSTHEFIHNWYQGIQICSAENAILQRQLSDFENPKPYKFEDLKPGMWVYDSKVEYEDYSFIKITKILSKQECEYLYRCKNKQMFFDNMKCHAREFEENRFYPVQMANVGCE